MTINTTQNRRCGPGGGTRQLHQFLVCPVRWQTYGAELGSTCVVKALLSFGMVPSYRAVNLGANDNVETTGELRLAA